MGIEPPRKVPNTTRHLVIVLSLLLSIINGLDAQERARRPSKYACPVIADLFPRQERSADILRYSFPENLEIPVDEVMADQIWKILRDRPLFILKNWPDIRSYKRNILASQWLQTPTDLIGMIKIYSDIANKEPKYRTACDEIIRILSEKSQAGFQ